MSDDVTWPKPPPLFILVQDAVTGEFWRVTGEEAHFLSVLSDATPGDDQVTMAGVGALRMRMGWSRQRFDRVRYALHSATDCRTHLVHELDRPEYYTRSGELRAGAQPFVLHPLVRFEHTSASEEHPQA